MPDPIPPVPPVELARITLPGGVVLDVPKAQAELFHAAQQKHNAERDELARKVGAAEAERKAAEDRAASETRDKEAMRLAKDGEVAKARELLTAETNTKLGRIGDRLKRQELEAATRRLVPGIETATAADIVSLVSSRAAFNADTGEVTFTDEAGAPLVKDGKSVGADAFLADYLSTRKHFQPARVPAGTGGTGTGDPPAPPGTIRRADVASMTPAQAAAMTAGKLTVVD